MIFTSTIFQYLKGSVFSNTLSVKITDNKTKLYNRLDLLTALCTNKKIIHVGFADHIDLIENKIAKNKWLHKRIMDVASECVGIDINKEAVQFIKDKLHIGQVYAYDLADSPPLDVLTAQKWDIMVLGEIIEHIDNPVAFLSKLREKYQANVSSIIVTAPNAFWFRNVLAFLRREEFINSDHRFWFTPYTLAKIGTQAGWTPERFEFAVRASYPLQLLYRFFPVLADTIIMIFTSSPDDH
jgi:hypothetical protein